MYTPEDSSVDQKQLVEIDYTNWKGERQRRKILPLNIYFGSTSYHPEPQWLLSAVDVEKKETRTFAMRAIHFWFTPGIPLGQKNTTE